MQGERLDGVAAQLTGLGLQAGCDIYLQGAMLTLNGANLQLQSGGVGLAPVGGKQIIPLLHTNRKKQCAFSLANHPAASANQNVTIFHIKNLESGTHKPKHSNGAKDSLIQNKTFKMSNGTHLRVMRDIS